MRPRLGAGGGQGQAGEGEEDEEADGAQARSLPRRGLQGLHCLRAAVLARVRAALEHAVADDDGLAAAEERDPLVGHGLESRSAHVVRAVPQAALEVDAIEVEAEARVGQRGLGVEALVDEARGTTWRWAWAWMKPPMIPNGPSSAPSRRSIPGIVVLSGRRPA